MFNLRLKLKNQKRKQNKFDRAIFKSITDGLVDLKGKYNIISFALQEGHFKIEILQFGP